jgi:hypothetical protein
MPKFMVRFRSSHHSSAISGFRQRLPAVFEQG